VVLVLGPTGTYILRIKFSTYKTGFSKLNNLRVVSAFLHIIRSVTLLRFKDNIHKLKNCAPTIVTNIHKTNLPYAFMDKSEVATYYR